MRASQPDVEGGALASLICHLAYHVRDTSLEVLFDVGAVWNAFDKLPKLKGEERRMARALVSGRPLVGAKPGSENSYGWAFAREFETFSGLLDRADPVCAGRSGAGPEPGYGRCPSESWICSLRSADGCISRHVMSFGSNALSSRLRRLQGLDVRSNPYLKSIDGLGGGAHESLSARIARDDPFLAILLNHLLDARNAAQGRSDRGAHLALEGILAYELGRPDLHAPRPRAWLADREPSAERPSFATEPERIGLRLPRPRPGTRFG